MFTNLALRMLATWHGFEARTRDEDGQTLAEYGLILSVVAVAVIVTGVTLFRNAIVGSFNQATPCLSGSC